MGKETKEINKKLGEILQESSDELDNEEKGKKTEESKVEQKEEKSEEEASEESGGDEEGSEEEGEEDETESSDLSEEEQANAKNLYLALKDPEASKVVIQTLAERMGLLATKDDTKQEKQEKEETVEAVISQALGKEYSFLAERLTPAIKKAIEIGNKDTKDLVQKQIEDNTNKEIDAALGQLQKEYPQASELEQDMADLMDEIKPGKNTTPYKYFKSLLVTAASNKGVSLSKKGPNSTKANEEKLKRNKNDAASRLASDGSATAEVNQDPSNMTLDDILKAADKEVREKISS